MVRKFTGMDAHIDETTNHLSKEAKKKKRKKKQWLLKLMADVFIIKDSVVNI